MEPGADAQTDRMTPHGVFLLPLSAFVALGDLLCQQVEILLVPPLKILTQNVTQNIESRRGADRNDLRVFGNFRPKKARKALGRIGLANGTQLITRRSEGSVKDFSQIGLQPLA